MKVTHDKEHDLAYIRLSEKDRKSSRSAQLNNGAIILDFDEFGILIGIEFLSASVNLPQEVLDQAE